MYEILDTIIKIGTLSAVAALGFLLGAVYIKQLVKQGPTYKVYRVSEHSIESIWTSSRPDNCPHKLGSVLEGDGEVFYAMTKEW